MLTRSESVEISAPATEIFDYVSDIGRHPEWAAQRLRMERAGEGFRSTVRIGPSDVHANIKVERSDRPKEFVYHVVDEGSGTYRWRFKLEPRGSGVRLAYSFERLEAPLWVRAVQPWLLYPLMGGPGMRLALGNIKRAVEKGAERAEATAEG